MTTPSIPYIKQALMLNLAPEQGPPAPTAAAEVAATPPEPEKLTGRRQSMPLLRRSSIVYEENIPVVVRRRGVTMTVRIFGAEENEESSAEENHYPTSPTGTERPLDEQSTVRGRSTGFDRPLAPTRWLVSPTNKKSCSRSVDSLADPILLSNFRRKSLFSSGRYRNLSGCPRTPSEDANLLGTPGTPNSLSPCSPDFKHLRDESPTEGIGLFRQVTSKFKN